jgi:hypothetical protein
MKRIHTKSNKTILSNCYGTVFHVVCETPEAEKEFNNAIHGIKDLWIDWEQSRLS